MKVCLFHTMVFVGWVRAFFISYRLHGKSPLTVKTYQGRLFVFLECVEREDCDVVSKKSVREFLSGLRDKRGLSAATLDRYLNVLKSFSRWLVEEGHCSENIASGISVGRMRDEEVKGLSKEEIRRLLNDLGSELEFRGVRNKAIVFMLLDCGLRVGESVHLVLEDIEERRGVIRVKGKDSKEKMVRMGLRT